MKTILVVDDDNAIQVLLSEFIKRKLNYNAIVAEDGEAAMDLARENKPDLIIMDMLLPRISGPALFSNFRQMKQTKDTPVIFISGALKEDVFKEESIEMGAVEYLTKPINMKYLGEKIQELLG